MLPEPIPRRLRRGFRISERGKGADDGHLVVSGFQESVGSTSWYMVEDGDKALLHALYKLLFHPWHEVVGAYHSVYRSLLSASTP